MFLKRCAAGCITWRWVRTYLPCEVSMMRRSISLEVLVRFSNLIALSVIDKKALAEWLSSDRKTRLRKFSPSEVRRALGCQEPTLLLADEDWYSRFCETYTHVTPKTRPNMHNASGQGYAGGVYQPEGLKNTLGELATVLGSVSLIICRYFKFSDLF